MTIRTHLSAQSLALDDAHHAVLHGNLFAALDAINRARDLRDAMADEMPLGGAEGGVYDHEREPGRNWP